MTFHMRFEESDRITVRNTAYKISTHTDTGVLLEHIDHPGLRTAFTFEELSDLLTTQDLRIERRYFDEANRINALRNEYDFLSHYPANIVRTALWQATVCQVFYEMYFRGEVQKTTASVKAALTEIREKTREIIESEQFLERSRRGGADVHDKLLAAPSTLLKLFKTYAEGGYRPTALILREMVIRLCSAVCAHILREYRMRLYLKGCKWRILFFGHGKAIQMQRPIETLFVMHYQKPLIG